MSVLYCFPPPKPAPAPPTLSARISALLTGKLGLLLFTLGYDTLAAPALSVAYDAKDRGYARRSTRQQLPDDTLAEKSEIRLLKVV